MNVCEGGRNRGARTAAAVGGAAHPVAAVAADGPVVRFVSLHRLVPRPVRPCHALAIRDVVEVAEGRLREVEQLVRLVAAVTLETECVVVDRAAPHEMSHAALVSGEHELDVDAGPVWTGDVAILIDLAELGPDKCTSLLQGFIALSMRGCFVLDQIGDTKNRLVHLPH